MELNIGVFMSKEILVKCTGSDYVDIEKMSWFQGKLKTISDKKFSDLKESIKKNGIVSPFYIWKHDGKVDLSDGHHRYMALGELKKEGYAVPKMPICEILAKDKKEAAEMILIHNARYAKMNEESFSDFMIDFGLDYKNLTFLDFKDIDVNYFIPNDSLSLITSPEEMRRDLEGGIDLSDSEDKQEFEQIPTSNFNENVKIDDIKEEKMDVVGRRYVIIIDCKDQDHKDSLKEKLQPLVEEAEAKFF